MANGAWETWPDGTVSDLSLAHGAPGTGGPAALQKPYWPEAMNPKLLASNSIP
jgi:hypothetical protein